MKLKKYITSIVMMTLSLALTVGCSSSENNDIQTSEVKQGEEVVVATSVAVTEILDKLGVKVSGVPTTSYELPESVKNATEVGSPMNPDMEIIKSLNPTVVVSVDTLGEDYKKTFTQNNIPSEFVNLTNVDGLKETDENKLYKCNGGFNYVFVTCDMKLVICPFARKYQYDLLNDNANIHDGHQWLMQQQTRKLSQNDKCFNCKLKHICKYCPARFEIESGSEYVPPDWYCEYGKCVEKRLRQIHETEELETV